MARYVCYLCDSDRVIETDDPSKLDELVICTETEFKFYKPIVRVIE